MTRQKYPSDNVDKTMVRFPPGMMDVITAKAVENRRSRNSEIIVLLERALKNEKAGEAA